MLATALVAAPGVAADSVSDDVSPDGDVSQGCEVYIGTRFGNICILPSLDNSVAAKTLI